MEFRPLYLYIGLGVVLVITVGVALWLNQGGARNSAASQGPRGESLNQTMRQEMLEANSRRTRGPGGPGGPPGMQGAPGMPGMTR